MKNSLIIFLLLIIASVTGLSQNTVPVKKEFAWVLRVLDKKDFTSVDPTSVKLTDREKMLYQAFSYNAHGRAKESNELIREIRKQGLVNKGDSLDFYLWVTEADNDVKLYNYKNADAATRTLLKEYRQFYNDKDLADEEETADIYALLSGVKPQTILKQKDTRIGLQKDIAGLWRIPVTMHDTTVDFVFDTGAGMSTIIRSYAKKMGVKLINRAFVEIKSGITGIGNQVQLGIAPELKVGDITVKNVVFLVFPDEAFSFANGAYVIQGILGLPVIRAFEEFSIENNEIFIPAVESGIYVKPNMILDLLKPVIYMNYRGKDLPFTFDSGADASTFSDNFYKSYQAGIDSSAERKRVTVGGAGGAVEMEVMVMPELVFTVHNKQAVFKQAEISTKEISTNADIYYGNVGQDLMRQFGKMTISFKGSYILFE